jgi:hypothetical protein
MFRKPELEIDWYAPSEITGFRYWLHCSWHYTAAGRKYDGFRFLGFQIELSWIWMTDEELEEWYDICRDPDLEYEAEITAGPPDPGLDLLSDDEYEWSAQEDQTEFDD